MSLRIAVDGSTKNGRSGARRSFDAEDFVFIKRGQEHPPSVPECKAPSGAARGDEQRLTMLVIKDLVAMPVKNPVEVHLKGKGVAVFGGRLRMVLESHKDLVGVRDRRRE